MRLGAFSALILILLVAYAPPAAAQGCTDVAIQIRGISSEAFDEYPLLDTAKQDILLLLYGRERKDCPDDLRDFATSARDFIKDFDRAYRLQKSQAFEDRSEALEVAVGLGQRAQELSKMKRPEYGLEAEDLLNVAQGALQGFLFAQGGDYLRNAEGTAVSRDKIRYYALASRAYEIADEVPAATSSKIKAQTLEERYMREMGKADGLFSTAEGELSEARGLKGGSVFSRVTAYALTKEAGALYREAKVYYDYHHEEGKVTATEEGLRETADSMDALGRGLMVYFAGVTILLLASALYVVNRLLAWSRDTYEYYLGNELMQVRAVEI